MSLGESRRSTRTGPADLRTHAPWTSRTPELRGTQARAGILKQFRVPGRRLFHCRRPWPRASCAGSSPPSAPPGTPHPAFPAPVSKRGLAHVCDPVALAGYQDAGEAAR